MRDRNALNNCNVDWYHFHLELLVYACLAKITDNKNTGIKKQYTERNQLKADFQGNICFQ